MNIISRASWGFTGWAGQPYTVALSERRYFVVHYHGGKPRAQRGAQVPRDVDTIHKANGWSGIGYNFVVDLDGVIYEGRGWPLVGAHCPSRNRDGIGVYVAVGDSQRPTEAALRAVLWLMAEEERLTGRRPTIGVHGDWYSTDCAGPILTPWVHAGMPVAGDVDTPPAVETSQPKEEIMANYGICQLIATTGGKVYMQTSAGRAHIPSEGVLDACLSALNSRAERVWDGAAWRLVLDKQCLMSEADVLAGMIAACDMSGAQQSAQLDQLVELANRILSFAVMYPHPTTEASA